MKNLIIVVFVVFVCFFTAGCGYNQYRTTYWQKKAVVEKMAVKKLDHQPIIADSIKGYYGIIASESRGTVTATVTGPETFAITLPPAYRGRPMMRGRYLLPGKYSIVFTNDRGVVIYSGTFHSDVQMDEYNGVDVHWFAWCTD